MADWWSEYEDKPVPAGPERSLWQRFKDSTFESGLNNSWAAGAEGQVRRNLRKQGKSEEEINRIERAELERYARLRAGDPAYRPRKGSVMGLPSWDTVKAVPKAVADLAGNVVGGVDPTYALGPGKTAAQRIAAQTGINAGMNTMTQRNQVKRGIKDEFSVEEVVMSAAAGTVIQGGSEVVGKIRLGNKIDNGRRMPGWQEVNDVIVRDLEGGGTLARPKVSPKGAMGPQQVMPETARKPGFGIRPWNGKDQADLARVGRQYSAAMMDKYDGDTAKVLAAYNAGPGRVDGLVKKYGPDWRSHLPRETKNYVTKGLGKLGGETPRRGRMIEEENADLALTEVQGDPFRAREEALRAAETYAGLRAVAAAPDEADNIVGDLPTERLAPAYRHVDGRVYVGPENGAHINIVERYPGLEDYVDWKNDGDGFVTPDGRFLNRKEAAEFVNADTSHLEAITYARGDFDTNPVMPKGQGRATRSTVPKTSGEFAPIRDPANDMGGDPIYSSIRNNDGLTPAERQDMDASAAKPDNPNTGADGVLGKGVQLIKDIANDESGAFRPGGRKGGPKGPDGENPDLPVEERFKAKLGRLKRVSIEQKKKNAAERKIRGGKLARAIEAGGGREGFYKQMATQKGDFDEVDYESIAKDFTTEDFNELFLKIQQHPDMLPYEKLRAQIALNKLLGQDGVKIPTPKELGLLSRAYSPELVKSLLESRTFWQKAKDTSVSALNIPRALMATADLSFPFRQGIMLVGKKDFWKAFGPMFKAFGSEDFSKSLQQGIRQHPNYELMDRAGLSLTDPHTHKLLSQREEDFMTDLAEKIPVYGHVIKASNRAFSAFANKLRSDYFNHFVDKYEKLGIDISADPERLKNMARYINSATGRGDLKFGKADFNNAAPLLNAAFFSPRLIKARLDMLNPATYLQKDPVVRVEAWKNLLTVSSIALGVSGLAQLGGMDVEYDPRSPDFMKPKTGDTRYDILGGFSQYIRLGAQILTNEKITGKGEEKELYGGRNGVEGKGSFDDTLADIIGRFFRGKENPMLAFGHNWAAGENVIGEPFNRTTDVAGAAIPTEVLERIVPMSTADIMEAYNDRGPVGAAMSLPTILGVGVQTYKPKTPEENASASTPSRTITVGDEEKTLTDEEYASYRDLSKTYYDDYLSAEQVNNPDWELLDEEAKKKELTKITKKARKQARDELFAEGEQGDWWSEYQ